MFGTVCEVCGDCDGRVEREGFGATTSTRVRELAMIHKESQRVYGEVDALVTLLNYECTNVGAQDRDASKWGVACIPRVCSRLHQKRKLGHYE